MRYSYPLYAGAPQQQPIGNGAPQQQPYVPYAQAPYQQGTTAYGVRHIQQDYFGPQDVRELIASQFRYAQQADQNAAAIVSRAGDLTTSIARSVQANSDAALQIARIEAETQQKIASAAAMLEALKAGRPTSSTRTSSTEIIPFGSTTATVETQTHSGAVGPTTNGGVAAEPANTGLLQATCAKCHAEPATAKGGFSLLAPLTQLQLENAAYQVLEGKMPPENPLPLADRIQVVNELFLMQGR